MTLCIKHLPKMAPATLLLMVFVQNAGHAQTVINFGGLEATANNSQGYSKLGEAYSTQGFTFSTNFPASLFASSAFSYYGDGETSLFSYDGEAPLLSNDSVTLTQNDGKTFNFTGIDLGIVSEFDVPEPPFTAYSVATTTRFTGTKADGSLVVTTKTLSLAFDPNVPAPALYQAFTGFTGFTNLTSLSFAPVDPSVTNFGPPNYDNVMLNTSPVPEASTTVSFGLLLALGMGGMIFAAKRKKSSAAA